MYIFLSAIEAIDLEVTGNSSDHGSSRYGPTPNSPLNSAPVQMHLKDKVLWPANSKGFSLSLWLRLEGLPDAEDGFLCKRNRRQVRTKTFGKASHSDNSTSMYILGILKGIHYTWGTENIKVKYPKHFNSPQCLPPSRI